MDASEIRNRTVSTVIAACAAAATTASFLYMFQDSADEVANGNRRMKMNKTKGAVNSSGLTIDLNGPIAKGIPKVGDASMLFPDFVGGLNGFAQRAKSLTPTGLGWFDNMGAPVLILSKPEHVRLLFSTTTMHALWGGLVPASQAFFGKTVLFVLEGDEWKRLRGILRASFKVQKLDLLSKDVTRSALDLSNRLQEFADLGQPVDMNAAFAMYHLAAIGRSSFDYDLDVMQRFPKSNDIADAFEYLLQELPRRSFHPDAKVREDFVSGTEDNIKWQKAARSVRKVVTTTIVARLDEERKGGWVPRGDLLDAMIASYRAAGGQTTAGADTKRTAELMMDAIGDNLVEIFFAGYNTSVVAMGVSLYYLTQDPKLLHEAQMEIDDVISDDAAPDLALNSKSFPFLSKVFLEALRMVNPSPLAARTVTEELDFDGLKIPTGTVVWVPGAFLHRDPQSWGSSVDTFDPHRWERQPIPGSFVPFNAGARDCIGRYFAELESVVALAVLLKTYVFEVDPGYKFAPIFTGFGYRPANANTMKVGMNLIPRRRTDVSAFIYDWTPARIPRRSSNPLLAGYNDEDDLPKPPRFDK